MSAPARGGFILIVAFLATAVFNYALGLLLAWVLPPASFGQVSVLLAIFYLTAIVLDAGFPWTLARTVSRGGRLGEAEVAGAVRAALVGNLVFSVVIGILVLAIQRVGGFGMPREFDLPVLVVAITLPVFAFNAVGRAILHGSMRFGALGFVKSGEVVVKVVVVITLIAVLGASSVAVAAGVLVGALAAAVSVAWLARDHRPRGGHPVPASTYLRALPMFIGTVSLAAMLSVDVLALGANHSVVVGGAAVIGTYQVASMVARLPYFLGDALINAVFPYMARRHDSVVDSHAYFTAAARWALLIVLPIEAILFLNPTPILTLLFPATYAGADVPIRILAIGASLALATVFFAKGLQAIGRVGAAAAGTATGLVVEALVLVTLVPRLGAVGAAIGFLAGTVTASAILGIVYVRHQRQPLIVGRDAVRHITALAVMAPPLLLARGAPTWIGIGSIGIALLAYVMAVFATRLVSWHEIQRYLDIAGTTFGISGRVPR